VPGVIGGQWLKEKRLDLLVNSVALLIRDSVYLTHGG
jgi:hypothetical protein